MPPPPRAIDRMPVIARRGFARSLSVPQMRRPAGDANSPKEAGHEDAPQDDRLTQALRPTRGSRRHDGGAGHDRRNSAAPVLFAREQRDGRTCFGEESDKLGWTPAAHRWAV
jgi:hypothetical protein